ncbi:acetylcholine receptor subunit beta-like [Trichogramma pretiosum]|uniref:acetylcholine receptor subunit beta-like n=1 Tax=Trichogramma pretiosum TaxID=7493 RepID=UPI0006C994A6|nr:acetylcholine receptor subunit beta-like [Trichogramma pretiosum]
MTRKRIRWWYVLIVVATTSMCLRDSLVDCHDAPTASMCKELQGKTTEQRLRTYLFCDYDPDLKPELAGQQKNVTKVIFQLSPKILEFDDYSNTLTLHCVMILNWTDPHLTWDPKDFDGEKVIQISSSEIWTPDLTLENPGDHGSDWSVMPEAGCKLSYQGRILCIPSLTLTTHCEADYANYPYDRHECSFQFFSYAYDSQVTLELGSRGRKINWDELEKNSQWEVLNMNMKYVMTVAKVNADDVEYEYKNYLMVTIQRRSAGAHVAYLAPAVILMVMTMSVLWLDCRSTERMAMACLTLVSHLLCIQDLFYNIPRNGETSPKLLKFYESSLMLVAFALALTVSMRKLGHCRATTPLWLDRAVKGAIRSRTGRIFLLAILDPKAITLFADSADDDRYDLVQAEAQTPVALDDANNKLDNELDSTWSLLTVLISWIAFVAVAFVYLVMLAVYMPSPPGTVQRRAYTLVIN